VKAKTSGGIPRIPAAAGQAAASVTG
jgi:hypothetical protein